MAKPERPWTVTPHSAIEKLDDNLWGVESTVPGVPMKRRMCIIKLGDGRLVFFHAIPLDDATLAEVTAWGKPAFLVVGHDQHGVDAMAFKKKLGLKLLGPKGNEAKLRKRFELDGTLEELPSDPALQMESIGGTKNGEPVVTVRSGNGQRASLLFTDMFMNISEGPLSMRLAGFLGGPKIPFVIRFFMANDKAALRAHFEKLASTPNLARIVPCHGDVITADPAGVLRKAATAI